MREEKPVVNTNRIKKAKQAAKDVIKAYNSSSKFDPNGSYSGSVQDNPQEIPTVDADDL